MLTIYPIVRLLRTSSFCRPCAVGAPLPRSQEEPVLKVRNTLSEQSAVYETKKCYVSSCAQRCHVVALKGLFCSKARFLQKVSLYFVEALKCSVCGVVHCRNWKFQHKEHVCLALLHQLGSGVKAPQSQESTHLGRSSTSHFFALRLHGKLCVPQHSKYAEPVTSWASAVECV